MSERGASAADARSILADLIRQRERMRDGGADKGLLEANRLGIVYWQWQLSRALGNERERPSAAA